MSLITRCPQCATLFKVEPEQLSVAQGWVRCGQCDHVFNATLSVVGVPVLQPAPNLEVAPGVPRVDLEGLLRRKDVVADSVSVPVTPPAAFVPAPPSNVPSRIEPALNGPLRTEPAHVPVSVVPPVPLPASIDAVAPVPSAHTVASSAPLRPSFLTRIRHSRVLRIGTTLLLVVGLWFQTVIYARNELAARFPGLLPVLTAFCEPMQCRVEPLRRLEGGVVIDSSSFARGDAGFVLNLTLRNSADLPLAMTSMELTLTDAQDRAVIRRVLSPADMGAPETLEPGQVWESALAVRPVSVTSDIAGYRLVSFYP